MSTSMLVVARLAALSHLALIVVLIVGGPLGVRVPWIRRLHVGLAIPTALVFLAGAACPLTVAEKWFLQRAGRATYDGGFIDHYLVQPVHEPGITPTIAILIPLVWLVPTVYAYGVASRAGAETVHG
ncbi:MAG: DUF2784 domain-containing protein [Acidimicrobiales bacterium]